MFCKELKNFDFDDPIIALKYNHALAVANLSYEIAETLLMNKKKNFILLDFSFENWKKKNIPRHHYNKINSMII